MSLRTAIIGGGPAGLVAAKCALDVGLQPTIYSPHLGGLWNTQHSPILWKTFKTNLSKYTCSFADLMWKNDAPMFPSQEDMYQYLCSYRENFVPTACIREETVVTKITRMTTNAFEVKSSNIKTAETFTELYDSVIVASGVFNAPIMGTLDTSQFQGMVYHSAEYDSSRSYEGKNIAVVGASFSACEIAADLGIRGCKSVHCIQPRAVYSLPRLVPADVDSPSTAVCPLDLLLYQVREDSAPLSPSDGPNLERSSARREKLFKSTADYRRSHSYLRSLLGESAAVGDAELSSPPYVAITDSFAGSVREGLIVEHRGRLVAARGNQLHIIPTDTRTDTDASSGQAETVLCDIDEVVLCTGYRPDLEFLDESILASLQHRPKDSFSPLLLCRELLHPAQPGLFFVGMYRGPYFAVMELQARLVAQYISGRRDLPGEAELAAQLEDARRLRCLGEDGGDRGASERPQFPHSDYVGMVCDLAAELDLLPPAEWRREHPAVLPADFGPHREAVREQLQGDLTAYLQAGRGMGSALSLSLQGSRWTLQRSLHSRLAAMPSGSVSGSASFATLTCDERGNRELLYSEQGAFRTEAGLQMEISAYYVYVYDAAADALSVWFADSETHSRRDRPFIPLQLQRTAAGWRSEASHQCSADHYQATVQFVMRGLQVSEVLLTFHVRGPHKDYTSQTVLTRSSRPLSAAEERGNNGNFKGTDFT